MNSIFNENILADKLSKLNNSQQCIETLSHWCIFHQKKAELVVQTWDKQFHMSQKEQKVPFLYLANDILQNSRRKGTEFVTEFWKVLPAALKDVSENGDERGKKAVSRLVSIWEERKVFGTRARGLKNLMLEQESLPALEFNRKRSRSLKIVRRDSRSIKIKLAIGGTVEKIVSAFHGVISEHPNEDVDLNKCKSAVRRVGKMEREVKNACAQVNDPRRAPLANELLEEETLLKQSIGNLKIVEETRIALLSQLKEALKEQESELENVRTQLQVAQAQADAANIMRRRLNGESIDMKANSPSSNSASQTETVSSAGETSKKTAAAIAAEVADKLAASTSSQQIMTSVLSTLAAEEAKNAGLVTCTNPPNSHPEFANDKRMKLEKPMPVSCVAGAGFVVTSTIPVPPVNQHQTVLIQQPSYIQGHPSNSHPHQYTLHPNPPSQPQYLQPSGGMMIGLPYGYGSLPPPPPNPPPPQLINMAAPAALPQPQSMPLALQQSMPLQQPIQPHPPPPPLPAAMFRPLQLPTMAFYNVPHQPH